MEDRAVLASGIATRVVGLALFVVSAWRPTPSLAGFLIGGAVVGAGAGAIFKGSLGTAVAISEPADRAQSVAGVLLSGYLGLSLPVVGMGVALRHASVKTALLGFAVLVSLIIVTTAPWLVRSHAAAEPPVARAPSPNG